MIIPYLFAVLLVPALVSSERYQISRDYNEIDKYLVEHLPRLEDVSANFDQLNKWLQKRQERVCGLGKCFGTGLNRAIELFLDLYKVTRGREICSPQAVEILRKNKAAAGFDESGYLPRGRDTRVSRMISKIGQKIAEECANPNKNKVRTQIPYPSSGSILDYDPTEDYDEIDECLPKDEPKSEDFKAESGHTDKQTLKCQEKNCGAGQCIGLIPDQLTEDFLDLYTLTRGPEICSPRAAELLKKNRAAVGFSRYWYLPASRETRVSRFIKAIGGKMAEECTSSMKTAFDVRIRDLDPVKLSAVQQHLDLLIQPTILWIRDNLAGVTETNRLLLEFQYYMLWNPTMHEDLVYTSLLLARNHKSSTGVTTIDHMKGFVEEFYLEPCKYYTEKLHDPLDQMIDYASIVRKAITLDDKEFYIGLGRYKWCLDLIRSSERLIKASVTHAYELEGIHETEPKFRSLPAIYNPRSTHRGT